MTFTVKKEKQKPLPEKIPQSLLPHFLMTKQFVRIHYSRWNKKQETYQAAGSSLTPWGPVSCRGTIHLASYFLLQCTHAFPCSCPHNSSCIPPSWGPLAVMHIQCFMSKEREGTDWEERWGSRKKSTEVGMGSAVRPRQQTESIKSAGLLLHSVVINRSRTLSPARRLTG